MNTTWLVGRTGRCLIFLTIAACSFAGSIASAQDEAADGERWKRSPERWLSETARPGSARPTMSGYLSELDKTPAQPADIVFAGSASIWMWDTNKCFPEYTTINRGFGGSMISDSTYFADRLIIPHKPKVIVMYAGENDVTGGKPVELIAEHFQEFAAKIHAALPETEIIYISIRPSNRNWEWDEKFREVNALIRAVTEADDRLHFVDVYTPMIGADGKPRPELYQEDDWHPSEICYAMWTSLVMPPLTSSLSGS